MMRFDPRLTPARPDVAASRLRGSVLAERFVDGETALVMDPVAPVRAAPRPDAGLQTEALYGEVVTVYDEDEDGWSWVQLARDGYVGYLPSHALLKGVATPPTHRVSALRSFIFSEPSIKEPVLAWLSLGADLRIQSEREVNGRRFGLLASGGAVVMSHVTEIGTKDPDVVTIAERFLGTPYLWGGKSSLGIDCSGLVQTAFRAVGIEAPRDSDMQEASLGTPIALDPAGWQRGDILCWPGHVALVRDATSILHANARQMAVTIDDLPSALARIAANGDALRSVKRV